MNTSASNFISFEPGWHPLGTASFVTMANRVPFFSGEMVAQAENTERG